MTRLLLAALLLASAARAGEPDPSDRSVPPVPSNGIDESPRRGTFAEASLGVFATLGGSPAVSDAQPYLGLTVGRDLGNSASIFASIGTGESSNSCFQVAAGSCAATDSFGATFLEAGASYGTWMARRLLLSHFWPGSDRGLSREQAAEAYDGELLLASEGMRVEAGA